MKILISVTVLLCQWNSICADPGIVEVSPQFRRSRGEKSIVSTKLQSSNLITDDDKSTTAPSTTSPSATIQSFKITADDVVMGTNTVYGTHAQIQNGGIIYAFNQGQGSTGQPLMSAAPPQPVLMQYLSPEGTPQQAAVQYIQLLRPLVMIPSSLYPTNPESKPSFMPSYNPLMPFKPITNVEPKVQTVLPISSSPSPSLNPYGPYSKQSLAGAYSSPHTSYFQMNPRQFESSQKQAKLDMGLNMNEYMPSASSHHVSAVLAPRSSMISSLSPYAYRPMKFQNRAQRA